MTQEASVLDKLVPLEPLDLSKCRTISQIVTGMSKCSFGARMLGEVADSLYTQIRQGKKPILISDIPRDHPLRELLRTMCQLNWFEGPYTSDSFLSSFGTVENVLVVGPYNRYEEEDLHSKAERMTFVNGVYQCRPGQVCDGYFPDVVFADESFVMSILYLTLKERVHGKSCTTADLMRQLEQYGGPAKETVHGAHTLFKMLADEDSTNMFTVSGAMTVGKMQLLVADLIDTGRIKYVAATGALMAHGLIEGSGCKHYKYDPSVSDEVLANLGLNRVTDSLEPESNFASKKSWPLSWVNTTDVGPGDRMTSTRTSGNTSSTTILASGPS